MQINTSKSLFYTTVVLTALFALTVLPNFKVSLGTDYVLEWNGLQSLGISSKLFNFTRGRDIFATKAIKVTADQGELSTNDFLNAYERDKQAITNRLSLINNVINADLTAVENLDDLSRSFTIEFPEYIIAPDQLAADIVSGANTEIIVPGPDSVAPPADEQQAFNPDDTLLDIYFPGYQPQLAPVAIDDIHDFRITTSNLFTIPILLTNFSSEVRAGLQSGFVSASYDGNGNPVFPMLLMIDGTPAFWAFNPNIAGGYGGAGQPDFPTEIIWVPFASQTDRLNLSIRAATIFGNPVELPYEITGINSSTSQYAPDGTSLIVGGVLILFLLLLIRMVSKYGLLTAGYYGIGLGSTVLTVTTLQKLLNTTIDASLVITFYLMVMYAGLTLAKLFEAKAEELPSKLNAQLLQATLIFLISAILLQFPAFRIIKGIETLAFFSVALMIASLVYYRAVSQLNLDHKIEYEKQAKK